MTHAPDGELDFEFVHCDDDYGSFPCSWVFPLGVSAEFDADREEMDSEIDNFLDEDANCRFELDPS